MTGLLCVAGWGCSGDTAPGGAPSEAAGATSPPPICPAGQGPGAGPNGTRPGRLSFPSPTIRNATVVWEIEGDANADAVVKLRYRKQGDPAWRAGLPLRRVPAGALAGFSWPDRHAGSLFDLLPATTYEVEAFLLDPDGGCEIRTGTVTTRAVPEPMPGAPVKAVTPQTLAQVASAAQPGDILDLAAGTYAAFAFPKDGAPGKPIVLRAAGAVTVTGDLSLIGRKYVHLVGLAVNGRIRLNATTAVSVTRCKVTTSSDGILAALRSEDDYIADNVVTGATPWSEAALGVGGANAGDGILVTGPGHVIEHNTVKGFRDGISLFEESEAVDQHSIDIVENDVYEAADDGVEADFCFHDCRVVRNRLTNAFVAMSSQPGLGGPTYFVRNVAYNVILSAFKLLRGSIGDVLLHNTVVKNGDAFGVYTEDVFSQQYARNNLFIGGPGGTYGGYSSGSGKILALAAAHPSGDYDYDGYGSTTGAITGRIGQVTFSGIEELRARTTEKHAVALDLAVFPSKPAFPASPFPARPVVDLRAGAGTAAEDVGVPLANVNDGFKGKAPDLGAYEVGDPLPGYGAR